LGLSSGGTPTSRNRLKEDKFLGMEIPLPPLPEQRRIVARIEELAAKINEARSLRERVVEEAQALWGSALAHSLAHGTPGSESAELPETSKVVRRHVALPTTPNKVAASWNVPRGWCRVSVAELLIRGLLLLIRGLLLDVKDGNHGSNHPRSSEFVVDGTPFLMASDIQDGSVVWNEASRLATETVARLRVGFAERHDVLFTHKASIGKTAIADRDCILSPQVTYYRCNAAYVEPRWLQAFLGSSLFLSQLSNIQAQSTRDFVSISKQYQQFVLLPPLSEQRRIVTELDALQAQVDALKKLQAETGAKLDAVLPSILDKAFKGEL
jgi:type I restriction enzyme, S subunit